jgi:uncharacterized protein YgbK (DUF1537 family)
LTRLRIVADDLTGALDSAVGFAGAAGPVLVCRRGPAPVSAACAAVDIGTRDLPVAALGPVLSDSAAWFDGADLCFKKIDSLLRGHWAVELAAMAATRQFDRIVVAPAFIQQGRLTLGGRLHLRDPEGGLRAAPVAPIADALADAGLRGVACRRAGEPCQAFEGVAVFDVVDEADLFALTAEGLRWPGRTLWVGAAGLARALAHQPVPVRREFASSMLMVIGSVHPRTAAQLERLRARLPEHFIEHRMGQDVRRSAARIRHLLQGSVPIGVLTFELPPGTPAASAEEAIRDGIGALSREIDRPPLLFVTGGKTLDILCGAVGCKHLRAYAEWAPGVVCATLEDGHWAGSQVISKSGAFGDDNLLVELASHAGLDLD